ncbi:MAG TPA: hypothetical protein VGI98_07005 [Candidatus Limnocylindrales bacterium]
MTNTTAPTDRADVAAGDMPPAADDATETAAQQAADAEASAEARTAEATTESATTVDERERTAAQPAAGATQSAPRATQSAPGATEAAASAGESASGATEAALFDAASTTDFRGRWQTIQVGFVDEPRAAVQQADKLVEEVLAKLQDSFGRERQDLEQAWSGGNEASTEDLRQAIRRYRSFFNRLLSI